MASSQLAHAQSLGRFIDRSPSPFHVVANAEAMLVEAGFNIVERGVTTYGAPGRYVAPRDGSLFAWVVPEGASAATPFRIVGAHTDSPNLRLKPQPQANAVGYRRVGVEVYGSALLNSWLDRDLGLSGRLSVRSSDGGQPQQKLLLIDEPILRIPQLAIHLDPGVNDKLSLDKQLHLAPIFGLGDHGPTIWDAVEAAVGVGRDDILGAELMLHDTAPSQLVGTEQEFLSAPRLDNQLSCHAAVTALIGANPADLIAMVALFDHEEVGSVSATGAAAAALPRLLDQISSDLDADASQRNAARDRSLFISCDNAHATHPNYPERHEPDHQIALNGGPVIKFNANQRYTTDSISSGMFALAAERAGVEIQSFVSRSNMACGSTIGPTVSASLAMRALVSASLAMRALDVGCAQLAMHSARELAGSADPWDLTLVLADLLS